jgi:anti-sigma factor RsiW
MANGCNKARENLDRFLDNDLSGREATDVAAHLDTCAACRQEFEQRRATQTALRRFAATPDGAQEARERVFARFERLVQEEARTLPAWRERVSLRAWRE